MAFSLFLAFIPLSLCTVVPIAPTNLTVLDVRARTATVSWFAQAAGLIHSLRLTIRSLDPLTDPEHTQDLSVILDGDQSTYTLHSLTPDTVYEMLLWAYNEYGHSNHSEALRFRTLKDNLDYSVSLHVHPGEILIVTCILVAWICAIVLFRHKWDKIRIIHSRDMRYKHSPKNLDTIKVVQKTTDSVIYKNYTPEVSKTMVARQKRLERMNTMPNIKVNLDDLLAVSDDTDPEDRNRKTSVKQHPKFRAFSRRITNPVIELEETQQSSV